MGRVGRGSGQGRRVKGFPGWLPCLAQFHFNRLSPEPGLADKDNENKSLSKAQQDEREAGSGVCLCVYHTPSFTEDRFSTFPFIR